MEVKPHIAILPSPGMGHLIPLLEFAKQLVLNHGISVTFIVTATSSIQSETLKSALQILPQGINHIFLPLVSFHDLPEDTRIQTKLSLTITRSLPFLRDIIRSLTSTSSKLVALITDHFGTDAFDVGKEFNVPLYLFFTSSALQLSFLLDLPKLDRDFPGEYRDLSQPVIIRGCNITVHPSDLPEPVQDRKNDAYRWFLHNAKRFVLAEGIIVNSFIDLEAGVIKALQVNGTEGTPPVYPVGPLIRTGGSKSSDCLKWLDNQPRDSVLFVSFGSGGTLSYNQFNELALGLEMSEQKFIWVVKSPDNNSFSGSYFDPSGGNGNVLGYLPNGFSDRIKGRGFLVKQGWAPQVEILRHESTGGFLTHCGWNSVLESVVHGVPLIAWPLFAEQKLNAVMLCEDLKVGLRPKVDGNGLVGREEIARVVKCMMEREEEGILIHGRMQRLKEAACKTLSQEGSSTKLLSQLVFRWNNLYN